MRHRAAFATLVIVCLAASGTAQEPRSAEVAAARAELDRLLGEVGRAALEWSHDPRSLVAALPADVTAGHQAAFDELLALTPESGEGRLAELVDGLARRQLEHDARLLASRVAPGTDARAMLAEVEDALAHAGSGERLFKGHFLDPQLQAPFGRFEPQCENRWCVPDLYIEDYDRIDLDGRFGNYCSVVPDFWFRWPCYQHDVGFAFAPMVTSSKLGSFLAINGQWWADMRTECHERIRFDWLNPEFIACQVTAFAYLLGVNNPIGFLIFNDPNGIRGYDRLDGDEPDPRHPPVYRRWHACTGNYTASSPFVSWNRTVLGAAASVPRGAVLELSGRAHRGTRLLFEFFDDSGALVGNHLTQQAADNCIVAQEPERFDTAALPPGRYLVKARFYAWEGGATKFDQAYDPPRWVAHGVRRYQEDLLTLTITAAGPGGGGSGGGGECDHTRVGCP
jgi:hypothetical protein